MKKVFITESEKIKIRKMYGLLSEGNIPSEKSNYSERTCKVCKLLKQNTSYLEKGAFGLQKFLKYVGHDIKIDGTFGNETATALGTFIYGYAAGINTPRKLAERMQKDGWNVGTITDTPYGQQMAKEVAKLIKKVCQSVSKSCDNQENPKREKWSLDKQNFNPQTNPYFGNLKKRCEAYLSQQVPKIKQEFIKWVNDPKTLKKLNSGPSVQDFLPIEVLKNVVNSININIYKCEGPFESESLFDNKGINGSFSPITNKIRLNYEINFPENNYQELFSTLIHETTHWIEGNLPFGWRQTINKRDKVSKIYPLSVKGRWESDFLDNQAFKKQSMSNVSAKSINEFSDIGVQPPTINKFIDYWNIRLNFSIKQKNGLGDMKYACSRQEKEANLKSLRKLYTGSMAGELSMENLKDIMNEKYDNSDEYSFIVCWAGNAFNPSPFEFLNLSNQLAVNDRPTDDTDTQNNQPLNLDFSDIDPQS